MITAAAPVSRIQTAQHLKVVDQPVVELLACKVRAPGSGLHLKDALLYGQQNASIQREDKQTSARPWYDQTHSASM